MLHLADVVEDETGKAVEPGQLARQPEVALGSQELLHQRRRTRPEHRVALPDQLVTDGRCEVAFPSPGLAHRDHVHGLPHQRATLEPLNLLRQYGAEPVQVELRQRLLARQARLAQQPLSVRRARAAATSASLVAAARCNTHTYSLSARAGCWATSVS